MKNLMYVCFLLVVFHSTHVSAGIIVDNSNSTTDIFGVSTPRITGITGINVLENSYDVTLNEQITDWSDSGVALYDWPFALAASEALLDIFETGYLSGTSYDLNPASAFGCSDFSTSCTWLTLVGPNARQPGRDATGFAFFNNIDDWTPDMTSRPGAPTTADYNTSYDTFTFLTWESSQPVPAPVPEPSTFFLLGGGLAGLAFYVRRRRRE
jgi:hypothetical protein